VRLNLSLFGSDFLHLAAKKIDTILRCDTSPLAAGRISFAVAGEKLGKKLILNLLRNYD
jgi:hypothetical protein